MSASNESASDPCQALVTREQLYDLAWQMPMLRVAEQFGVSSSYMARVFTELRVPRPSPGYWAQREFGKAPPKPELPVSRPGDETTWRPGSSVGTAVRAVQKAALAVSATVTDPKGLESPATRHIRTANSSTRHELLIGVKSHFLNTRKVENGILRPYKKILVDILASEAKLDYALATAQALFEALNRRGFHVGFAPSGEQMRRAQVELFERPVTRGYHRPTWAPERPTVVYVGATAIGLTLFEMTEEVEVVYVSGKYLPVRDLSEQLLRRYTGPHHWRSKEEHASGRFCLQAYCPSWRVSWSKRWQETKPNTFRGMVPKIVDELEAAAPELAKQVHEAKLRAEEEARQWEEERRQRQVEAERLRQEKARQDAKHDLLAALEGWDEARRVNDYFEAVEAHAGQLSAEQRAFVRERLRLARELVGELDPLALLNAWKAPNER